MAVADRDTSCKGCNDVIVLRLKKIEFYASVTPRRTMQICYHERVFIKGIDGFSNVTLDFGLDVPPGIDVPEP